jgi:m7GpppX diphosphatase
MTAEEQKSLLAGFTFHRILHEDPKTRSASILGHYEPAQGEKEAAVLLLEKTHFSPTFYENVGKADQNGSLDHCSSLGSNDVYNWLLGWMSSAPSHKNASAEHGDAEEKGKEGDAHVKMTLIRPATDAHIAKYTEQLKVMVVETPEMYETIVKPWIESQPPERLQWVYNILEKKKEAETILYEKTGNQGYIVSWKPVQAP